MSLLIFAKKHRFHNNFITNSDYNEIALELRRMISMKKLFAWILTLALFMAILPQVTALEKLSWMDENTAATPYPVEGGNIYFEEATGTVCYADETVTAAQIPSEINGIAVKCIGSFAFTYCEILESVVIPDCVETVEDHAFMGCDALKKVIVGDGVKLIGGHSFLNCDALTELSLGSALEEIEMEAFADCDSLETVTLPASLKIMGFGVFSGCSSLKAFAVDENNTVYSSDAQGVLFDKEKTELLQCPEAFLGAYEVPNTVIYIADYAFAWCEGLTDLTIAESVIDIGYDAFYGTGCYYEQSNWEDGGLYISNYLIAIENGFIDYMDIKEGTRAIATAVFEGSTITAVNIPDTVKHINLKAFSFTNLKSVTLPNGLERIECGLFNYATDLQSVYIPESVTSIGPRAFVGCHSLTDVYFAGTRAQWEAITIEEDEDISSDNDGLKDATIHCADDQAENPFADISETDYYYDAVLWAVENGVTNGISATEFAPNENCTRGQIVTFLWRANGSEEPTTTENPFTDVKESDYYYKAVLWAVENGITNGMSETTFEPDSTCTRAQAATFLWRAHGCQTKQNQTNPFVDVQPTDYYYDAVAWAVENGITNGVSATEFAPDADCTRGQIVTFLHRAAERAKQSPYVKVIQEAIESSEGVFAEGMLYDIDGNGVQELILMQMVYTDDSGYGIPYMSYSVYTINDNQAIALLEDESLYVAAGGAQGWVGILKIDDEIYFGAWNQGGDIETTFGSWNIYSVDGSQIELNTQVTYRIEDESGSATINGENVDLVSYEAWVQTVEALEIIDAYGFNLDTLLQLL